MSAWTPPAAARSSLATADVALRRVMPTPETQSLHPSRHGIDELLLVQMERIVRVHYGGEVIESDDGCAKFSSDMAQKVVAFVKRPKYNELVSRVRNALGWEEPGVVVDMQGRYDVGHGHSYKGCDFKQWIDTEKPPKSSLPPTEAETKTDYLMRMGDNERQ
ncbi:hypothetical protein EJB05_55959, partial [Eragrostis curvula]